jgi:arylsulfatase
MNIKTANTRNRLTLAVTSLLLILLNVSTEAQDVLPFPTPPMGGTVGPSMQESVHKWRETPSHLPEDAPNILIVMFDDAGFGQPSTFGGLIETPTLSRLANEGFS